MSDINFANEICKYCNKAIDNKLERLEDLRSISLITILDKIIINRYDALPGIGHTYGHNLIAIGGVAAAIALKAIFEKHEIPGKVKLFGTPAEENGGGKLN
ncbi:unnamed protein product [Rhizophagus irregularis]|nr:unnamed protein product [Rhizophagus irregularis]